MEKGKYLEYGWRRAACGGAELQMLEDKQGIGMMRKERTDGATEEPWPLLLPPAGNNATCQHASMRLESGLS